MRRLMASERWRRIEDLYHAVLEQAPEKRASYLAQASQGDEELQASVEALLRQDGFVLDGPASDLFPSSKEAPARTALTPGAHLGPYRIEAPLGAGGMGEVYRARDTRLGRAVAIKILRGQYSRRFQLEAQAISALNHPNICTLHDVGADYLVMELVEGVTLAQRIAHGPLPLDEALAVARQIGAALEAAHERGIVHRDLKPANIKIQPDGTVKVLDFGLAKMASAPAVQSGEATQTLTLTVAGTVMGTPSYMAPEQAQGQPADKRADIWAFGVVLYEMLSGRRPFTGGPTTEIMAAVSTREPDWKAVPPRSVRLLRRCLERDARKRLRDIGDFPLLLEDGPPPAAPRSPWRGRIALAALAALTVVLALLLWRASRPGPV
jgi:serine/threonine protein kinase